MGLLTAMQEASFFQGWASRFGANTSEFITPDDPQVTQLAREVAHSGESDVKTAEGASKFVHNRIKYKLSRKWKTPSETISSGIGDCEDLAFLLASILPNVGVTDFNIEAGKASNGVADEYHVWLRVDGVVIDPTANPMIQNTLTYKPNEKFKININP